MRIALFCCLLLAACTASHPVLVCPPLAPFDKEEQMKLAASLHDLPADSPIWRMALDWEKMRAVAKACAAH